jgi:hypothetical protein
MSDGQGFDPPSGQFCDVVMKGGITSGVVYPKAICALAGKYRFRNVGGTSAGAIAAAATAAAEYGRDRQGGGFAEVEALRTWLGEEGNLVGLFQPQKGTRRLRGLLIGSMAKSKLARFKVLGFYAVPAFLGFLPGLLIATLLVVTGAASGSTGLLVAAIVLALLCLLAFGGLGALIGAAVAIGRDLNVAVVENQFGVCSGMPYDGPGSGFGEALTPWLHERIEKCAGPNEREPGEPLTFRDLWTEPGGIWDDTKTEADRYINLAVMTTNLVNRRAHQMPWENHEWFFKPDEFLKLFPKDVVDHMVKKALPLNEKKTARSLIGRGLAARQGLLPLPEAADLPVIVATRMSLSFPVLLSAVPLWRFDYTWEENECLLRDWRVWGDLVAKTDGLEALEDPHAWPTVGRPAEEAEYECCWFSDGGISSNFPVHFFDRLVPRWPTFAIDLRPFPFGRKVSEDQAKNVEMPERNGDDIADWWYRFPKPTTRFFGLADGRLLAFLGGAVKTMQNRVDEAQMRVPGYRDRIAHVNLASTEGGMNLNMNDTAIKVLAERGEEAAELLIAAYDPKKPRGPGISWRNHRWTRFRSSLAVLEKMTGYFVAGVAGEDYVSGPEPLIETADSYKLEAWQRELAKCEVEKIEELGAAVESMGGRADPPGMAFKAPSPPPIGQIAPKE